MASPVPLDYAELTETLRPSLEPQPANRTLSAPYPQGASLLTLRGEAKLTGYFERKEKQAFRDSTLTPEQGESLAFALDSQFLNSLWGRNRTRWSVGFRSGNPWVDEEWNSVREYSLRYRALGIAVVDDALAEHPQLRVWVEVAW